MSDQDILNELQNIIGDEDYGGPLNQVRTARFSPYINHMFAAVPESEGITTLRFDPDTSSNGAINRDGADAVLHCDASQNEHAQLETTEHINYAPGTIGAAGWTFEPQSLPSGEQDLWIGATNKNDGVGIGLKEFSSGDGTPEVSGGGVQPYVFFEKGGNDRIRIPQEHWNQDTLDGSNDDNNPSGKDINDWLDGAIIRIDPQLFYGHGVYKLQAVVKEGHNTVSLDGGGELLLEDAGVEKVNFHNIVVSKGVMLDQPNVPIMARCETNGTAQAIDQHWTSVHYERASDEAETRLNGETRTGQDVDTAWEPLISWRKRSGWDNVNSRPITVVVSSDTNLELDIQLGATLNGASFGLATHTTSSETALEFDTSATGFSSTGERRWVGQATGGTGNQAGAAATTQTLTFNLPGERNVTLAAKAASDNAVVNSAAITGSEF
jgi:hypothetical protein